MRAFISQLRPSLLSELGLNGSIEDGVATIRALTGATIETDLAAPPDQLTDEAQIVVLRVMQEALQNVRRHADAHQVRVSTHLDDDAWTLEVADDGRGFDVDAVTARGRRNFGLQFMRDRAELIGARFDVRFGPSERHAGPACHSRRDREEVGRPCRTVDRSDGGAAPTGVRPANGSGS